MKWLDSIINSADMILSQLWEIALESSSIFRADILGPAGKLKPEAGQTSKRHTRAESP